MYIPTIVIETAIIVFCIIYFICERSRSEKQAYTQRELEDARRDLEVIKARFRKREEEFREREREMEQEAHEREKEYAQMEEEYFQKELESFSIVVENEILRLQESGIYKNYDPEELHAMIFQYGETIGVVAIVDIDFSCFEKTIKAAIYASKGYFDIHTSPSGVRYRIGKNRKHIPITIEEIEKLKNHDFDFVYDSVLLEL